MRAFFSICIDFSKSISKISNTHCAQTEEGQKSRHVMAYLPCEVCFCIHTLKVWLMCLQNVGWMMFICMSWSLDPNIDCSRGQSSPSSPFDGHGICLSWLITGIQMPATETALHTFSATTYLQSQRGVLTHHHWLISSKLFTLNAGEIQ